MNKTTSLGLALGLVTSTMLGVQALMMSSVKAQTTAQADLQTVTPASGKPASVQPAVSSTSASDTAVFQSSSICYTCGGNFPFYGGTIPTPSAATERGESCGGGFTTQFNDHNPYLCTK